MLFVCNSGHVDGSLNGGINQEGLDHYNNVINELLKNGKTILILQRISASKFS